MLKPSSIAALENIREKNPGRGKVVFISGYFNILHPGHLRLLRFAAECGDFLVVGVYAQNQGDTFLDADIRFEGVQAISLIDYAFLLGDPPEDFISVLKPDVVVKGKEHENASNPEEDAVKSYGGKILFSSGDMSFSLAELLHGESQRLATGDFSVNNAYMNRHQFNWADLEQTLNRFSRTKVVVIGDVIVDEYITCDTLGMSQEDPTIVVTPVGVDLYLGGAGIVAAHAGNLGADVTFFSVTGEDEIAEFAQGKLTESGVSSHLFSDSSRPTILKQRYRSSGKTLLRVNHLRQHPVSREIQAQIKEQLFDVLENQDLVVFSDFNYGCLPNPLVNEIITECRQKNIMMVADSQSSSQIGDVSRFSHMELMTPTEREARLALKDFESGLVVLAEKLRKKSRSKNVFITLGEEGLLIHADTTGTSGYQTDQLEAMNSNPIDPAGAGDSLLTCSALSLAAGADIWQCAYLGSVAAACQVGRKGNIPLSVSDLNAERRS